MSPSRARGTFRSSIEVDPRGRDAATAVVVRERQPTEITRGFPVAVLKDLPAIVLRDCFRLPDTTLQPIQSGRGRDRALRGILRQCAGHEPANFIEMALCPEVSKRILSEHRLSAACAARSCRATLPRAQCRERTGSRRAIRASCNGRRRRRGSFVVPLDAVTAVPTIRTVRVAETGGWADLARNAGYGQMPKQPVVVRIGNLTCGQRRSVRMSQDWQSRSEPHQATRAQI